MDDQQSTDKKPVAPGTPSSPAPDVTQPPAPQATAPPASEKPVNKTADAPHWITIAMGFLSPFLAAVALWISLKSLRTGERSLEIGQRAYVSLQNGKMVFSHMIVGPPPSPSNPIRPPHPRSSLPPGGEQLATVLISVTVANSGNTPAQFTGFTPSFQLPDGWALKKQEWQPLQKFPPEVGAKSQEIWEHRASFVLTPQAWSDYLQGPRAAVRFSGQLVYRDVFSAEHAVDWCWATFATERNEGYVADCDKYSFEKARP